MECRWLTKMAQNMYLAMIPLSYAFFAGCAYADLQKARSRLVKERSHYVFSDQEVITDHPQWIRMNEEAALHMGPISLVAAMGWPITFPIHASLRLAEQVADRSGSSWLTKKKEGVAPSPSEEGEKKKL